MLGWDNCFSAIVDIKVKTNLVIIRTVLPLFWLSNSKFFKLRAFKEDHFRKTNKKIKSSSALPLIIVGRSAEVTKLIKAFPGRNVSYYTTHMIYIAPDYDTKNKYLLKKLSAACFSDLSQPLWIWDPPFDLLPTRFFQYGSHTVHK